jgi:hypothetical protein
MRNARRRIHFQLHSPCYRTSPIMSLIHLLAIVFLNIFAISLAIAQTTPCPFHDDLSLCETTTTVIKPQPSTCFTATQTVSTGNCQPAVKGCQRSCPLIPLVTTTLPGPKSACPHTPTLTSFKACTGDPCSAPCPKSMMVTVTGGAFVQ